MPASELTTRKVRKDPKARPLALDLVDAITARMRDGRLSAGFKLPPESAIMSEFGVSRTVVREALSKLQACGLVQTRHGIGSFVQDAGRGAPYRLPAGEEATSVMNTVAVLELRMGVEAEAAAMAAARRSDAELRSMRAAQADFERAARRGLDTRAADQQLHLAIARATHNHHFLELLTHLDAVLEPSPPIDTARIANEPPSEHLMRVHAEHESFVSAISNRDPEAARAAMRTHLANSRERLRRTEALPRSN